MNDQPLRIRDLIDALNQYEDKNQEVQIVFHTKRGTEMESCMSISDNNGVAQLNAESFEQILIKQDRN